MSVGLIFIAALSSFAAQSPTQPASQALAPSYEDSVAGLKQTIKDVVQAAKDNNQSKLLELTGNMVLQNPGDWFNNVFGKDYGPPYAETYAKTRDDIRLILANTFLGLVQGGFTDFDVHRFTGNCDESVDPVEFDVLYARAQLEPLCVIRFRNGAQGKSLRFFAYADGGFRFLGNLRAPIMVRQKPQENNSAGAQTNPIPTRIPVPGDVQKSKLVNQVLPIYPKGAQRDGVQGTVRIHAIISKDGHVIEMNLVSGPCVLAEAAFDAVGKWRFSPTTLNNIPVEVECTFDVKFILGK
jgi:protein TonB